MTNHCARNLFENNNSFIRSDEGLTLETSAFRISLRWPIHIINPIGKTKLSCYISHRHNAPVSLETYILYLLENNPVSFHAFIVWAADLPLDMTSRVNVAKEYTIAFSTEDSAIISESTLLLFYNDCRNGRIVFLPQRGFFKPLCAEKKKKCRKVVSTESPTLNYTHIIVFAFVTVSRRVVPLTSA